MLATLGTTVIPNFNKSSFDIELSLIKYVPTEPFSKSLLLGESNKNDLPFAGTTKRTSLSVPDHHLSPVVSSTLIVVKDWSNLEAFT